LTIGDGEWINQVASGPYEPRERAGGAALLDAYQSLGYWVMYVTGRPQDLKLDPSGELSQHATARWLRDKRFPFDDRTRLYLSPSFAETDGQKHTQYKADTLETLKNMGFHLAYAYGNSFSDIAAFAAAGIAKHATFIVGEVAGAENTVAIGEETWESHHTVHLPNVPTVRRVSSAP
jgi:hypothetical protein